VIAFTPDIASVNYGKNCSFYQTLHLLQPSMVKASCHCRTDHHAARHLLKLMSRDVESFVLKVGSTMFFCTAQKMLLILRRALNLSRKFITRFCVTFLFVGLIFSKLLIVCCSVGSPKI